MKSVTATFSVTGVGKEYEYFVRINDECPEVGDYIVTSLGSASANSAHYDGTKLLNVARVVRVNDDASECCTKFYLWHIPHETLRARMTHDKELVEREKRRKAAIVKLRELAEARALIDSLKGSDDPEIQALIKAVIG